MLERAVRARSIDVALGNRVERLLPDGVVARGDTATANALVIATGGLGQRDMLRRCYPTAGERHSSMSTAGSQGDGITMAAAHGATITGHDTGLLIPCASIARADRAGRLGDARQSPWSSFHRRVVVLLGAQSPDPRRRWVLLRDLRRSHTPPGATRRIVRRSAR